MLASRACSRFHLAHGGPCQARGPGHTPLSCSQGNEHLIPGEMGTPLQVWGVSTGNGVLGSAPLSFGMLASRSFPCQALPFLAEGQSHCQSGRRSSRAWNAGRQPPLPPLSCLSGTRACEKFSRGIGRVLYNTLNLDFLTRQPSGSEAFKGFTAARVALSGERLPQGAAPTVLLWAGRKTNLSRGSQLLQHRPARIATLLGFAASAPSAEHDQAGGGPMEKAHGIFDNTLGGFLRPHPEPRSFSGKWGREG